MWTIRSFHRPRFDAPTRPGQLSVAAATLAVHEWRSTVGRLSQQQVPRGRADDQEPDHEAAGRLADPAEVIRELGQEVGSVGDKIESLRKGLAASAQISTR
jgi:hypothetical protein